MKVLIEIDEGLYQEIIDNAMFTPKIIPDVKWAITSAMVNGVPLNGTNGEVLLKMFPPSVYFPSEGKYMALLTKDCIVSCSNVDWWNAEYKGGKE